MNTTSIIKWIETLECDLGPPGCFSDYAAPTDILREIACTINIMNEHRFAFYYWATFYNDYILTGKYKNKINPILITLDYHNDVGTENDFEKDELKNLDISNKNELALFCWSYLRSSNNGHILPALFLNFFSNIYVLKKHYHCNSNCDSNTEIFLDKYKTKHLIKYFADPQELTNELKAESIESIYLDIDLDYFTNTNDLQLKGESTVDSYKNIRNLLNLDKPFMKVVIKRLIGLTIALEPIYCGGIRNSFHIFNVLNNEFFDDTLGTAHCKWKESK